jgi:Tol biopolymer transport system component
MGEVYRALDARLGREVAIKLLPAAYANDADRLRRFELEARAASALNHPNILTIFDIGASDGMPYIVTELLEGGTLHDRLLSGPMPVRKAVECCVQIAQGLAAAHEKGIVHRDLKPQNIFLCRDGRVKILDFGLAKLTSPEPEGPTATHLDGGTEAGEVLGTVGYMSPEQVRGETADPRSDIFNFGTVLYEMLAGKRAFSGQTRADTASAILKDDPPSLLESGKAIPAAVDRIIHHCLEKNREQRFQSARDLAFQLESVSSPSQSRAQETVAISKRRAWIPWVAGLLVLIGAGAGGWWLRGARQANAREIQFQKLSDFAGLEETPALSPDGKSVAFVADTTGTKQVWIRLLAGGPPLQITHDEGQHLDPRWSHDSATVLYYTPPRVGDEQGTIWEISALGGAPRRLATSLSGPDVSHDGNRLTFFRVNNKQVELVTADRDGSKEQLVSNLPASFSYRCPRWSPDDRTIGYLHASANWADDVYLVAVNGGEPHRLTNEGTLMSGMAWLPDGSSIIYSTARGSTVLYLPTLHLWKISHSGGQPQQLTFGESGDENPDVDSLGRIVASRKRMTFDLWKFPVDGSPEDNVKRGQQITHQTGQVQTPSLNPDDSEIAYLSDSGGHGNLWIRQLKTGDTRQITFERKPDLVVGVPIWSPDGNYITFATNLPPSGWGRDIGYWLVHPDGSNPHMWIPNGAWAAWSGDSKWLYYSESTPVKESASFRLLKSSLDGGAAVTVRSDNALGPAPAPDGTALYYIVPRQNLDGSSDYELRVAQPEDGPSKLLVRVSGQRVPIWQGLHPVVSKDGKWLAMPLNDNLGTNVWIASTTDGKLKQVTDFAPKRSFVARRVSWSSDGKWIFAAVGEGDSDIVLMDGVLR